MGSGARFWSVEQKLELERERGERAVKKDGGLNRGRRAVKVKQLSSGSVRGAVCRQTVR